MEPKDFRDLINVKIENNHGSISFLDSIDFSAGIRLSGIVQIADKVFISTTIFIILTIEHCTLCRLTRCLSQCVALYPEEADRPAIGQGLNKLALITLKNIFCINKTTQEKEKEQVALQKFEERLVKSNVKTEAEFVSYDSDRGTWVFKVQPLDKREF